MSETEVSCVVSYPQRSDGRRTAELAVTDKRSGLTICTVTLTPEQMMNMLSATHTEDHAEAELLPPEHRWKLGKYARRRHLAFGLEHGRSEWTDDRRNRVVGLTASGEALADEFEASLPDVGADWHRSSVRSHREGYSLTWLAWTDEPEATR